MNSAARGARDGLRVTLEPDPVNAGVGKQALSLREMALIFFSIEEPGP